MDRESILAFPVTTVSGEYSGLRRRSTLLGFCMRCKQTPSGKFLYASDLGVGAAAGTTALQSSIPVVRSARVVSGTVSPFVNDSGVTGNAVALLCSYAGRQRSVLLNVVAGTTCRHFDLQCVVAGTSTPRVRVYMAAASPLENRLSIRQAGFYTSPITRTMSQNGQVSA